MIPAISFFQSGGGGNKLTINSLFKYITNQQRNLVKCGTLGDFQRVIRRALSEGAFDDLPDITITPDFPFTLTNDNVGTGEYPTFKRPHVWCARNVILQSGSSVTVKAPLIILADTVRIDGTINSYIDSGGNMYYLTFHHGGFYVGSYGATGVAGGAAGAGDTTTGQPNKAGGGKGGDSSDGTYVGGSVTTGNYNMSDLLFTTHVINSGTSRYYLYHRPGGVLLVICNKFVNNGTISANAIQATAEDSYGGAGGGVIIVIAQEITNSGVISANGESTDDYDANGVYPGGGGGGFVALSSIGLVVNTGTVQALGGTTPFGGVTNGQDGTVLIEENQQRWLP